MKPWGYVSVVVGVLGFAGSFYVELQNEPPYRRDDLEAWLVAAFSGVLNPLFFVGVPLGLYWLSRCGELKQLFGKPPQPSRPVVKPMFPRQVTPKPTRPAPVKPMSPRQVTPKPTRPATVKSKPSTRATLCWLVVIPFLLALGCILLLFWMDVFSGAGHVAERQAEPDAAKLQVDCGGGVTMELVLIPAGEFMMGWPMPDGRTYDNRQPHHRVRITKPFYLGVTEVTQGQWKSVMGTEPWSRETYVKEGSDYAASCVSWDDAVTFCERLSRKEGATYRLPTEAEWEYACRAGTTTLFHFGDDLSRLGEYAWFDDNADEVGEEYAHRVGQKKPNPWGLYDMHGNVYEWCSDLYNKDFYANSPPADPRGPLVATDRVNRGGCWIDTAGNCGASPRNWDEPTIRVYNLGFRVAADPPGESGSLLRDHADDVESEALQEGEELGSTEVPPTAPGSTEVSETTPGAPRPYATGSITDVRASSAHDIWCEGTFTQKVEGVTGWMKIYRPRIATEGGGREVGKVRVFRTQGNQAMGNCGGFLPRVGDFVELYREEVFNAGNTDRRLDSGQAATENRRRWVGRVRTPGAENCYIEVKLQAVSPGSQFRVYEYQEGATPGRFLGMLTLQGIYYGNMIVGRITNGVVDRKYVILEEL